MSSTTKPDITFCPFASLQGIPPQTKDKSAVISILDYSEQAHYGAARIQTDLKDFKKTLSLRFVDRDDFGLPDGIKDDTAPHQATVVYPNLADRLNPFVENVFVVKHAQQIAQFIDDVLKDPDIQTVYVHCYAGISRSSAVALCLSRHFGLDLNTVRSTEGKNQRVVRILDQYLRSLK